MQYLHNASQNFKIKNKFDNVNKFYKTSHPHATLQKLIRILWKVGVSTGYRNLPALRRNLEFHLPKINIYSLFGCPQSIWELWRRNRKTWPYLGSKPDNLMVHPLSQKLCTSSPAMQTTELWYAPVKIRRSAVGGQAARVPKPNQRSHHREAIKT